MQIGCAKKLIAPFEDERTIYVVETVSPKTIVENFLQAFNLGGVMTFMCEKESFHPNYYPGYKILNLEFIGEAITSNKAVFSYRILGFNQEILKEYVDYFKENREGTIRDRGVPIFLQILSNSVGRILEIELIKKGEDWCVQEENIPLN